MFISQAFAEAGAKANVSGMMGNLVPLIVFIVVFYFLLIRPQQKRMKQHQEMVRGLKTGDKVYLSDGLIGKVKKVKEYTSIVEIAPGVEVEAISNNLTLWEEPKKSEAQKK